MIQFALRAMDAAAAVLPWRKRPPVGKQQIPRCARDDKSEKDDKSDASDKTEPAHLVTGRRGEEAAYFYLRRLGYVMVARNWRSPRHRGEVDLIGWDGDVLCFIEVKTRTTRDVKPAEAAVDADKQRELSVMALDYLRRASSRGSSAASRRSELPERQGRKDSEVSKVATKNAEGKRDVASYVSTTAAKDAGRSGRTTGNWQPATKGFPPFRFDIVSVYYENLTTSPVITVFRNAFAVS